LITNFYYSMDEGALVIYITNTLREQTQLRKTNYRNAI
jgi:hypothetical protein